jgi:hypothetical protein
MSSTASVEKRDIQRRWARRLLATLAAAALLPAAAFAEDERLIDLGQGKWTQEFRLPDSYLPDGFIRDPTNRHWIMKGIDPTGLDRAHTRQYAIMPTAYVANWPMSPRPGDPACPMGYASGAPFILRPTLGGWFRQGYQTETAYQFDFIFQVDSAVIGMYFDVREATFVVGLTHVPRPSVVEIEQVVRQFVNAYRKLVADRGWTNLAGKPPSVLAGSTGTVAAPPPSVPVTPPPTPTVETKSEPTPPTESTPPPIENAQVEPPPADTTNTDLASEHESAVNPSDVLPPTDAANHDATLTEASTSDEESPVTAGEAATGATAVGLLGLLGSFLMLKASGLGLGDVMDGLRRSVPPIAPPEPAHHDGEVNDAGDVWSAEDRGWVGRNLYDQERARRTYIDDVNEQALHTRDAGVADAAATWVQSQKDLQATIIEGPKRLARKLEILDKIAEAEREQDHYSETREVLGNFGQNLLDERDELERDASWLLTKGFQGADRVLRDPDNWAAVGRGVVMPIVHPVDTLVDSAVLLGKGALLVNAVGNHMLHHPWDTTLQITGYENFSRALDSHVPIGQRLGCAVMGAADVTMTFGGLAQKGAAVAGRTVDAWRRTAEIEKIKATMTLSEAEQARKGAWAVGQANAEANVERFLKNPNDPEVLKAIQSDHRAINAINRDPEVARKFNEAIAKRTVPAEAATKAQLEKQLADEGLDLSKHEVRPNYVTNPTAKVRAGADADVTYSIYNKEGQWVRDVPASQVKDVRAGEYYKAWHDGAEAPTKAAAEDFSKTMRQEHIDRLKADAYGRTPEDLNKTLRRPDAPLDDPEQIGKAIGHKTSEELAKADEMRNAAQAERAASRAAESAGDTAKAAEHAEKAAAHAERAEEASGYGYRQAPKQAANVLEPRAEAARAAGQAVGETPEHITFGVELTKRIEATGAGHLSPVEAEKIYQAKFPGKRLGDLGHEIGDRVAAIDKGAAVLKPPPAVTAEQAARAGWIAGAASRDKDQ